jgi:hypothetical protein
MSDNRLELLRLERPDIYRSLESDEKPLLELMDWSERRGFMRAVEMLRGDGCEFKIEMGDGRIIEATGDEAADWLEANYK